jgi:DNA topoisomerase-1
MIRVGSADCARQNRSYGLTTLRDRHVAIEGSALRFHFTGKSGKTWRLTLRDRRVARIVKASQDLPGQHLFQYLDEAGERREVTSTDVNAYLRETAGRAITAKDFRTWTGTVLAALALAQSEAPQSEAHARRVLRRAVATVAAQLGNSIAICRKCYIHPEIITAYREEALRLKFPRDVGTKASGALAPAEAAVLAFLSKRLGANGKADT